MIAIDRLTSFSHRLKARGIGESEIVCSPLYFFIDDYASFCCQSLFIS